MTALDTTFHFEFPAEADLSELVRDVWRSFLSLDGDLLLEDFDPQPHDAWTTGTVSISGAWQGHVVVSVTPSLATTAARAMLMADDVSEEDVSDAVGELANILGGTVKSLGPGPSALSLPHVGVESPLPHFPGSEPVRTVRLLWEGESLQLTVWAAQEGSPS